MNAADEAAVREDYHRLVQGGHRPPVAGRLRAGLEALDPADVQGDWQVLLDVAAGSNHDAGEEPLDSESLAFHAPLGLIEGAWLQGLARAENGHRPAVAELFAAYLTLLGRNEADSPATAYRGLLARAGCLLPPVGSWQFSRDERIGLPALRFAALQLELGHAAGSNFPEAIGFTLGHAAGASPWRLAGLEPARRRAVLDALGRRAARAMQIHLTAFDGAEIEAQGRRLLRGHALYRCAEAEYRAALEAFAARRPSMEERVADLLRRKAAFARGYHGAARLGGRPLDEWFSQEPFDAVGFLRIFAASAYAAGVAGQRPFDKLTGFGGPMFGIFSREELALIGHWLDALPQPGGAVAERPLGDEAVSASLPLGMSVAGGRRAGISPPSPAEVGPARHGTPGTRRNTMRFTGLADALPPVRELFHRLVNIHRFPEVADAVPRRVEEELRRAERALKTRGSSRERFFEYSPQALAERIERIHRAEVARYRPCKGRPRLQKEEYVFGIRQFAPAILVDGCWLQHACTAAQQDDRLHRLLFHIFADELGAGRVERNHPNVYRELLRGVGVNLPELEDAAFARDPGFLDAAFDLPVYLLGISFFPGRWLPELLGLNLAIELSGLGAQYMTLAEELEYWGLDPLIVRLHLSIDSLAGGHAARAAEAVQVHLERVRAVGGEAAVRAHWRRVWCGYLSLRTTTRRFQWALGLAFCRRFLPGLVTRGLRSVLG